ncbi:MAG: hypothetical protein LBQ41_02970 [Candidatus Ancillula sp.]|jgi:hypothetical protein|nr:hypothetical protein [Candidatus Ancillula sp.]
MKKDKLSELPVKVLDESCVQLGSSNSRSKILRNLTELEVEYILVQTSNLRRSVSRFTDIPPVRKAKIDELLAEVSSSPEGTSEPSKRARKKNYLDDYYIYLQAETAMMSASVCILKQLYSAGFRNFYSPIKEQADILEREFASIGAEDVRVVSTYYKRKYLGLVIQRDEYERESCNFLLMHRIPHLGVLFRSDDVIIGPLNTFSLTPCINCAADALGFQVATFPFENKFKRSIISVNPVLTGIAAGFCATTLLEFVRTDEAYKGLRQIELPDAKVTYADLEFSSMCNCRYMI